MKNSNFVFDELLRLNLRTDRHEIFIPTASASLLTKFQSSSNCNNEKVENSLDEKILVFNLENGYIFNLFEKAKGLSYEVQIFIRDSRGARLPPVQRASSYSDRKCPFEGLEDRLGSKLMQQQLVEAYAAAASTTRCWTIVRRLRRCRGRAGGLTSLVEA